MPTSTFGTLGLILLVGGVAAMILSAILTDEERDPFIAVVGGAIVAIAGLTVAFCTTKAELDRGVARVESRMENAAAPGRPTRRR